jgi:hypothetical protein
LELREASKGYDMDNAAAAGLGAAARPAGALALGFVAVPRGA